jgi:subtilase family protein
MASTTGEDTPHDGAPTSWSSEIDQLVAGVSGEFSTQRLMLISAGNTDNFTFGAGNYLDKCDHEDNDIESPAQSWNALSVGAYTEKTLLPAGEDAAPLASFGDLSPSSRTASWSSTWPLKPDVVLEGGNWALSAMPPPMRHGSLSLLISDVQVIIGRRSDLFWNSGGSSFWNRGGDAFWTAAGAFGDIDVQVRVTNDDPAGSPVWSGWTSFDAAEFDGRAFQFRAVLSAENTQYIGRCDRADHHCNTGRVKCAP